MYIHHQSYSLLVLDTKKIILLFQKEWELYWVYVDHWRDFISNIGEEIMSQLELTNSTIDNTKTTIDSKEKISLNKILSNIHTVDFPLHKVSKYLHRLVHTLSVYYKCVHILPPQPSGQVPPHLLPKLWARLHLLKCLQHVMDEAFSLLNIIPPTVM